jgi:hypothetical protein
MQTKDFLSAALGGDGYVCVFGANPKKKRVIQKLYPTIDAACSAADNLKEEGFDAYFGLATYATDKSRRADNAKHLKCFFLDIDCGPHKSEIEGYPGGQRDGLVALQQFCKAVGLPKPTLVNSGRGIHVYWFLTEPVAPQEWLPVAERLKSLCVQHNLIADPAVTADIARVLRVPGTLNFKDDPAKPVEVIGEPREPLTFEQFRTTLGVQQKPRTNATFFPEDDVASALLGNYRNVFKTILMKTADGRGCAQLQNLIQDQENVPEPLWRGGLSIAKFCVDADKAAHRISSKHPNYDPDETAKKLEQIRGPYTCDTFDKLNPGLCGSCPNKGKIKSPIVLGREIQEASEEDNVVEDTPQSAPTAGKQTYVIPAYPAPYFRGIKGGVFLRKKDKDGDTVEVPVYHNDLYVLRRLSDPEVGEGVVIRLHLPKDGVREFTIPLASMLSKDEFRKYMAMNGVAVINMEGLMAYMTKWVNKLQAEVEADIARKQFGWTNSDMTAFVAGSKEIHADRIEHNPPSNRTIQVIHGFQSKGTLEGWVKLMEFYNRPGMELHQYMLGLSFGSPLVAFSTDGAALFHAWSKDPGFGKTAALRIGNSVWGHPEELMCQERDTMNSKMNRAEVWKNVFLTMDELSNIAPKDASDFLYQLTGYRQRNRLSSSGNTERYRGDPWRMNVASTGNTSLISRVLLYKAMPKAEAVRVLEYHVPKMDVGEKAITDEFNKDLDLNYGTAHIPYMQYVIRKKEESQQLFRSVQERIDKAAGLSQPHRFWSSQAASALAALIIAKKLGLVNFDLTNLFKWIVGVIETNKATTQAENDDAETVLTSYLAENYNNVLRIKSTDDARLLGAQDVYIVPDSTPRVQLVARYEYDVKKLYLLPKPFREWCLKLQLPYQDILSSLKTGSMKAVTKKMRIGKGTRMNLPPTDTLMLDCTDFMSEDREDDIAGKKALSDTQL